MRTILFANSVLLAILGLAFSALFMYYRDPAWIIFAAGIPLGIGTAGISKTFATRRDRDGLLLVYMVLSFAGAAVVGMCVIRQILDRI